MPKADNMLGAVRPPNTIHLTATEHTLEIHRFPYAIAAMEHQESFSLLHSFTKPHTEQNVTEKKELFAHKTQEPPSIKRSLSSL